MDEPHYIVVTDLVRARLMMRLLAELNGSCGINPAIAQDAAVRVAREVGAWIESMEAWMRERDDD